MNADDLKQYYNLYTDCWKLFREYAEKLTADTLQDDDYWRRLSVDADNLAKQHGASTLAAHLAFDTICGIEDLAKSMKE